MLNLSKIEFDKIIVTTDLLRIDDRNEGSCENSQRKMAYWLQDIVGLNISKSLNINVSNIEIFHGDEDGYKSLRWQLYSSLNLPLHYTSWALLYDNNDVIPDIIGFFEDKFKKSLVLSYEASPVMINIFDRLNIPYIDFSIHPIRFLPDYFFGIRTNVKEWVDKISSYKLNDDVIQEFAQVSKARTTFTLSKSKLEQIVDNSAIFYGQMDIDASLIVNGEMATHDMIEESLIELSSVYQHVYYKRHPHNKNISSIEKLVKKIKRCSMFDINVYDSFAINKFELLSTLSSGSTYEAQYFNKQTKNFIKKEFHFNQKINDKSKIYYPIYEDYWNINFWNSTLKDDSTFIFNPTIPNPYSGAMKFNLNKIWGR